jgi:hypothetical protein
VKKQNELCFVQFIHPGKEHRPDRGRFKDWNRVDHKRKFVENMGSCIRSGEIFDGLIRFWTEWEPQSEVIATITGPDLDYPRFVYRPFYVIPSSYRGLQNTDPFVFGHFFYTGCQQHTSKGPTQLRYLDRGSVVLFGSCVSGRFAIDTVLVVDKWIDHNVADFETLLRDEVPRAYWEVTLAAWYQDDDVENACAPSGQNRSYRLYFGATVDHPVNGMFSFFPCAPAEMSPNGFARPVIENPAVITNNHKQKYRLNRGLSAYGIQQHWRELCRQVESAGLWLGVHAETPERRDTVT